MSTYVEEDTAWFVDRPTVEPPDLSRGDHEDAARVNREQLREDAR